MSLFSLVWANLFRKRTRTTLTLLSVTIAFLLFALLQAIAVAFDGGVKVVGADRLVVGSKFSQVESLPISQRQQILSIEGVTNITHSSWFGGTYQDPRNFFGQFPVPPLSYFEVYSELDLEPENALQRFANERTTAVVDITLAERFGWQVGDVIPLTSQIYPKNDGDYAWEFELVGIYSDDGEGASFPVMLINYDYFSEAAAFGQDQVGQWTVQLESADRADEIANEIDALFENSADPTRTATEDESNRQFARQLGDMGLITTMIMGAVFFTIVLLTGNTMAQALRERIPELAVLKTLGFSDVAVSMTVLLEAMLLCVVGGGIGVGIALLLGPGISENVEGILGSFVITPNIVALALGLSIVIGLVIGMLPAWSALRLPIVEALRRQ